MKYMKETLFSGDMKRVVFNVWPHIHTKLIPASLSLTNSESTVENLEKNPKEPCVLFLYPPSFKVICFMVPKKNICESFHHNLYGHGHVTLNI